MELRSGEKFKIEMRKAFFFSICLEDPVRHGRAKPSCRQIESSTRSILFPRENERKSPLELSGTCLNNPSYHCLHINGPALPAPRPSSERKKGPSSSISNLLSYWHSWTQFSHSFSRVFFQQLGVVHQFTLLSKNLGRRRTSKCWPRGVECRQRTRGQSQQIHGHPTTITIP